MLYLDKLTSSQGLHLSTHTEVTVRLGYVKFTCLVSLRKSGGGGGGDGDVIGMNNVIK